MSMFDIFPDFVKDRPNTSFQIFSTIDSEVSEEKYEYPRRLLLDQIFRVETISKKVIELTRFVILYKSLEYLPKINEKSSINGYSWFVGHYDWRSLLIDFLDFRKKHSERECVIYMVPIMGQAVQGSERYDLTYNAFFAFKDMQPFDKLIKRVNRPDEEQVQDEELDKLPDYVKVTSFSDLGLEWSNDFTFDRSNVPDLDDAIINVYFLNTRRGFRKQLAAMSEHDFSVWYDVVMGNFKPFIPPHLENGIVSALPTYVLESVECTIPIWTELQEAVEKVNNAYKDESRCIQNTYKYWQISPGDLRPILLDFITNKNTIVVNEDFKDIFFSLFARSKEFIIEEIFEYTLGIKRTDKDEEPLMWKDSQIEIEIELSDFDEQAQKKFGNQQEVLNAILNLKPIVEKFFDVDYKNHIKGIFNEWKSIMETKLLEKTKSPQFSEFMKAINDDASSEERNNWIKEFEDGKVLYSMWPMVYAYTGTLYPKLGEEQVLKSMDEQIFSGAHIPIPGFHSGKTLPERKRKVLN